MFPRWFLKLLAEKQGKGYWLLSYFQTKISPLSQTMCAIVNPMWLNKMARSGAATQRFYLPQRMEKAKRLCPLCSF
ncbi:MAG TPA: hypothetical protein DEQ87_12870 [Algoriphagus sp.]|nr:hypothetical protein [Algoriphagus sp.]MAN86805.1 hypothetical protein [Algoriphagus sp.]HAD51532.1 hypothetical protein [Algoriphagus sp.]HAS59589.1 hypothetical protein [Algoriphagus sp.]HAZ26104.1 hypothetical protein [Algoriphagus sp.]